MSQAQNRLIERMSRQLADANAKAARLEVENGRLRTELAVARGSVAFRVCATCGITSKDVPMFQVGDVWLCGPVTCGAETAA